MDRNTGTLFLPYSFDPFIRSWNANEINPMDFIDDALIDLGVFRIDLSLEREKMRLDLIMRTHLNRNLETSGFEEIVRFCKSQISDGFGENGFDFHPEFADILLEVDHEAEPELQVIHDLPSAPISFLIAAAAKRGDEAELERLLASGQQSLVGRLQGYQPLHLAILNGHFRCAKLLIHHGADVNALCASGATPLMICALAYDLSDEQSVSIAKVLLSQGADFAIDDNTKSEIADIAISRDKPLMAAFIRSATS